jgi:hypothetical protein
MDQARSHTAEDIEDKISNVTESVLNIIPENVEKPHIPKNVQKTPVEKH